MNAIFEPEPRYPRLPHICITANLPAFLTPDDAAEYRKQFCPNEVVLTEWKCQACRHFHFWSGAPADTNGGILAGSRTIPQYIKELIQKTKI